MGTRLFIIIIILIVAIFLSYAMNMINMIRINKIEKQLDYKLRKFDVELKHHKTILEDLDEQVSYLDKEIKK